MSRCSGHCCRKFTLPLSPMELQHWVNVAEKTGFIRYQDIEQIAEIVIFKFTEPCKKKAGTAYVYTCKNFDTITNNCMIYDSRPQMCRNFPNDEPEGKCRFKGCTL